MDERQAFLVHDCFPGEDREGPVGDNINVDRDLPERHLYLDQPAKAWDAELNLRLTSNRGQQFTFLVDIYDTAVLVSIIRGPACNKNHIVPFIEGIR